MSNYQESDWAIKAYGLEECKRRDAYYEDYHRRAELIKQKAIEHIDELYNLIREYTTLDLNFRYSIKKSYNGEEFLSIESDDFCDKYSFLQAGLEKIYIKTFNSNTYHSLNKEDSYREESDFSRPCETVGIWMSLVYEFKLFSGGTNSIEIGSVRMEDNDYQWKLKPEKKRYK
jgi:hypothetical protein